MQTGMARWCATAWRRSLAARGARRVLAGALATIGCFVLAVLAGCQPPVQPTREPLLFYGWADEVPLAVFDAFTAETGIPVRYLTYESTEDAVTNLRAGQTYDVVVMESRYIEPLARAGLLAELNRREIGNFKNVAASFRGLVFDPQNRYSIPYSWGTTGLVARTDLVGRVVTSWNDLWDPALAGKVAIWRGNPREVIALTLKSLGYSANSEDPAAMAAVQARLIELRKAVHFVEEWDAYNIGAAMARGRVVLSMGYAYEARTVRKLGKAVDYVLPKEGALLWGDNFVVPASSQRQADAARLIDFLLRPDIAAQIVEHSYLQLSNDAVVEALPLDLRTDPLIFAPEAQLRNAEILLPLSPAGEALCDKVWQAFLAADGPGATK